MEVRSKSDVTNRQPDIGFLLVLHWRCSSISNLLHVIRDFYSFKIGSEVALAVRWRPAAEMISPFDSTTPILHRRFVENNRLSLTVQKIFGCIDLAGKMAFRFENLGFWWVLTPKCNFVSTQPPKGTSLQQSASFEPSCIQIGSAVWAVEAYKNKKR